MDIKKTLTSLQYSDILLCCFCLCALFLCINPKIANAFQILCYLCFIPFFFKNKHIILQRLDKFKFFFYIYFLYAFFELIPLFFSPDLGAALKIWLRTYFLRGTLFLLLIISFNQKKQYLLVLLALISSFTLSSLACLILGPDPQYGTRVGGFYGHPMIYAGFSCIALPFFIFKLIFEKKLIKKLIFLSISIFFFSLLILNGTRGAWIAVFLVSSLLLVVSKLSWKNVLFFLPIFLCLSIVSIQSSSEISNRIKSLSNPQMHLQSERILLWKSSFEMFKDHPLTGVGLGNYASQYKNNYMSPLAKERTLTRAHSNIFQLIGESGLFGLVGYLIITFGLLYKASLMYLVKKNRIGILIASSIICLFVQGLTEYNLGHSSVMKFYWLWLGTLFPLGYLSNENCDSV